MREFETPIIEVKPIDVEDEVTTSFVPGANGSPIG